MSSSENQGAYFGPPNQQPDVADDYPLMPPGLPQAPGNTDPAIPPVPTSPPEVEATTQSFELALSMRLKGDPAKVDAVKRGLRRALMDLVDANELDLESFNFDSPTQTTQEQTEAGDQTPEAGEATPQPSEAPLFTPEIQQKLDTPLEDVLRRIKIVKPYSPTEESERLPAAHQQKFVESLEEAGIYSLRDVALVGTDQVRGLIHSYRTRKSTDAVIEALVKETPDAICALRAAASGSEGERVSKSESMQHGLFTIEQVTAFCNDVDQVPMQVLTQLYDTPSLPDEWRDTQVSQIAGASTEELSTSCNEDLVPDAIAKWQAAVHAFIKAFQAVHPPQPHVSQS